jgi:predicted transcriptional regulator
MMVLWDSKKPMTATEIINASNSRSWKEASIYIIMNTLLKKGAVVLKCYKPTGSNTARAYEPLITSEDYTFSSVKNIMDTGVRIDISVLVERLMSESKG